MAEMERNHRPESSVIHIKWPSEELVDLIGFRTKAGNRIKDYLKDHRIVELNLRELIDLFLPPASFLKQREKKRGLFCPQHHFKAKRERGGLLPPLLSPLSIF